MRSQVRHRDSNVEYTCAQSALIGFLIIILPAPVDLVEFDVCRECVIGMLDFGILVLGLYKGAYDVFLGMQVLSVPLMIITEVRARAEKQPVQRVKCTSI